jgi:hypothetical protein
MNPALATPPIELIPSDPLEDPMLTKLRNQIAANEYTVDANLVAEEMVRKMRFIKWAREELATAPDRTPIPKLRGL